MPAPLKIFIIYARKDTEYKEGLIHAFRLLKRQGLVEEWHDGNIKPGAKWEEEIDDNLRSADIILALISDDFFDSDYIQNVEIEKTFARFEAGEVKILPIIVRKCHWEIDARLARLQVLPKDGVPISSWSDKDAAYFNIVEALITVVSDLQAEREHYLDKGSEEQDKTHLIGEASGQVHSNLWEPFRLAAFGVFGALIFLIIFLRFTTQAPVIEPTDFKEEMVLVKGGSFKIGDCFGGEGKSDEYPAVMVTVSDFSISKHEVTFDEFDRFIESFNQVKHDSIAKRENPDDKGWGRGKKPVINVSWYDAIEYCNWLSEEHGRAPFYDIKKDRMDPSYLDSSDSKRWLVTVIDWSADGYRLPTEAEWEYAARQLGQKVRFGNGRDIAHPREINFNADATWQKPYSLAYSARDTPLRKTCQVDTFSFPANNLKLMQMSGNVMEWCWDWYNKSTYYSIQNATDPIGVSSGAYRVVRGGAWGSDASKCRVSSRANSVFVPDKGYSIVGFRIVCCR